LISDGGNRNSGNMCKALAAGADCIMLGRLVAGCDESPSKSIYRDGKLLKVYRGMAGFGANVSKSQRMGIAEPGAQTYTPEGVEGFIPEHLIFPNSRKKLNLLGWHKVVLKKAGCMISKRLNELTIEQYKWIIKK